jgi:hypothetical protein
VFWIFISFDSRAEGESYSMSQMQREMWQGNQKVAELYQVVDDEGFLREVGATSERIPIGLSSAQAHPGGRHPKNYVI